MTVAFQIVFGFGFLIAGAELLVRGASRLARAVGLTPLVIGLIVVAYGTSAPEFAVSMKAGLIGKADIALGNVVGSNTFNVLFILGVSALTVPLTISRQLIRLDVPVMILVSVLTWVLAADGTVSRLEGAFFIVGIVFYTALQILLGRRAWDSAEQERNVSEKSSCGYYAGLAKSSLFILGGLGLLVVGARWLVAGSIALALLLGVEELVISLTIVAAGTSLPELATSVVATIRDERDIAVGNIVGSNIFNILCVLGASAAASGTGISVALNALKFDIPVMTATALVCMPIFFTGGRISRWERILFLCYYLAYVVYLILAAKSSIGLEYFGRAMWWFVIPLTAIGVLLSFVTSFRTKKIN